MFWELPLEKVILPGELGEHRPPALQTLPLLCSLAWAVPAAVHSCCCHAVLSLPLSDHYLSG